MIKNNIEIKYSNKVQDYSESIKFMEKRVVDIFTNKKKEIIWFLNHDDIYTIGTSGSLKEIHSNIDIPIIKTNRGGKVTYHGKGQRIIYFLINLNNKKKDIRKFVSIIEKSAIDVLNEFDIEAKTFSDRIGIWVVKNKKNKLKKEKKIGAIGLRVKKWITYHGLSFNIDPNLDYYNNIDACGLSNYSSTSLKELGINITSKTFDKMYLNYFLKNIKDL